MNKRILSLMLAICMVLTAFAPSAMAVEAGELSAQSGQTQVTATEDKEIGKKHPMTNSLVSQEGKDSDVQLVKPGTNLGSTGTMTQQTGSTGSWSYEETDTEAAVELRAKEYQKALAELKVAAKTIAADEKVVAFVVMEEQPLVIGSKSIRTVSAAAKKALLQKQDTAIAAMNAKLPADKQLQVRYQFTYLTNSFTVETEFGNLETLLGLPGVKSVFLAPTYEACDANPLTASSGQMVGVPQVWQDLGYTGKGMKIAIIDTGLDLDHPAFREAPALTEDSLNPIDISEVFAQLNATARCSNATPELLYRSEKVPFAFNYCDGNLSANHDFDGQGDHGTHVAGIAAANRQEDVDVVGMAPDAQVIVMKVFGNNGSGASADNLVAALEDAMTLGCDVANMSVGSENGFSAVNEEINLIYQRLATQDIILTASAGNEGTSTVENMWGTDLNLTSNPENSTVSQPSTYANVMSIGSAENAIVKSAYFTVGDSRVFYMDSYEYLMGLTGISLMDLQEQALEYVMVPGLGDEASYFDENGNQILDVAGKVAVVPRGEISFSEKVRNAEAMGAVAVLIWNNVKEDDIFSFGMTTRDDALGYMPGIPVSLISYTDGAVMAGAEEMIMTVSSVPGDRAAAYAGEMSSFSSWGSTSDLRLLPDIVGIGGNVFSTLDQGKYGIMSGTSMSAPQVAGITALVMEYLKDKHPGTKPGDVRFLAEVLMMSTADVITDSYTGLPYPTRQQGSGLVDADGALLSDSYLTVGGERPKVELKDSDTGVWKFSFEIHNFGDETQTYDLSSITIAPGVEVYSDILFMSELYVELGSLVKFDRTSVTVAPGETATVSATLQLSTQDKSYIESYFPNGTYVEGFVYLTCEGGQDLSLPFLGFYGDWTEAPVFDTGYWYDNGFFGLPTADGLPEASEYYHAMWVSAAGTDWVLGMNPYAGAILDDEGNIYYNENNNAISPNGDGMIDGINEMYITLLRNAKEMTITYSNGDTVLHQDTFYNNVKSMYDGNYGQVVPWLHTWYGAPWDYAGVADGTTVTVDIEAYVDYGTGGKHKISFPVTVDTTAPLLEGIQEGVTEDGTPYLLLQIGEARPAAVHVMNPTGTQFYTAAYDTEMYPVEENSYQVILPIGQWGTELMLNLCDYAGNERNYIITYTAAGENKPEMDTSLVYGYQVMDMENYSDAMYGWSSFDKQTGADTQLVSDMYEYYALTAAEYVDGYIFAVDAGYNLVRLVPGVWNRTQMYNLGVYVKEMTWDEAGNTLYALTKHTTGTGTEYKLETLDLMTGTLTEVGSFGSSQSAVPVAMSFDGSGNLYAVLPDSSYLYTVELSTMDFTAVTDADGAKVKVTLTDGTACVASTYAQSMTYSKADNALYWAYNYGSLYFGESGLAKISLEDFATSGQMDAYFHEFVGLVTLEEDADYTLPYGGALQGIALDQSQLVLQPGTGGQLNIVATPWDYDCSGAAWTSSNEAVVTVEGGTVSAVGEGTATVTVTLGEFTASCQVTVVQIGGSLYGYNLYSADGTYGNFFRLDPGSGSYSLLGVSPFNFVAGDYNGYDDHFYGYTENGQFYRVDMDTLQGEAVGTPVAAVPKDMAFDYSTGTLYAVVYDANEGASAIYAVDMRTGMMVNPTGNDYGHYVAGYPVALAAGPDGTLYLLEATGLLYAGKVGASAVNMQEIMDVLPGSQEIGFQQSMAYDFAGDGILWACPDGEMFFWISPDANNPYVVELGNPLGGLFQLVGLFTVPETIPTLPQVEAESFSAAPMVLGLGQSKAPELSIRPVNATDVTWTLESADSSVAVIENGLVKAVGLGETTVTVTLNNGLTGSFTVSVLDIAPYVYGFQVADMATGNGYNWIRIHTEKTNDPDYLDTAMFDIFGAEKVGDKIYAYGFDGADWEATWQYFVMDGQYHTIESATDMGAGFPFVYDLAYDYSNGTMYALAGHSAENIDLYVADMETGSLVLLKDLEGTWLSLAAGEGSVWLIRQSQTAGDEELQIEYFLGAELHRLDVASMEMALVGDTGVIHTSIGSMTYDTETRYLYWAAMDLMGNGGSGLYLVEPNTAVSHRLGNIGAAGTQMSGLYVIPEAYPEMAADAVTGILLTSRKEILTAGETVQLGYQILPASQTGEVSWASSNEAVATVDAGGLVTTYAQGAADITVTVTQNGATFTATCRVVALQKGASFLTWNESDMGWATIDRGDRTVTNLTEGEKIGVATFAQKGNDIYGFDTEGNFFSLDWNTLERTVIGAVNAESIIKSHLRTLLGISGANAADLSQYRLEIRDMAFDTKGNRMLVIAAVQELNDYWGLWEETEGGNAIYSVNLTKGTLSKVKSLPDWNNRALTVLPDGSALYYCCYNDEIRKMNLSTGEYSVLAATYTQAIYGSTTAQQSLYYDALTQKVYLLLSSNDRYYRMVELEPESGEFSLTGNVGELWNVDGEATGDMFHGLAYVTKEKDVTWAGGSLTTDGTISVNVYVALSDAVLADENARMIFNVAGRTHTVALSDAKVTTFQGQTVYGFACPVAAKEMTETITCQVFGTDGTWSTVYGYSVAEYYEAVKESYSREEKPELYALVEAMLRYGAASQTYFGYNLENLPQAPAAEEAVDATAFAPKVSGQEANLQFMGASLVLEESTDLRLFFRSYDEAGNHAFAVNGEAVEAKQKGDLWFVEIENIAAKDLDEAFTVTVGGLSVEYSALSYVATVLQKAEALDEDLVAVAEALYRYNAAANGYFG